MIHTLPLEQNGRIGSEAFYTWHWFALRVIMLYHNNQYITAFYCRESLCSVNLGRRVLSHIFQRTARRTG